MLSGWMLGAAIAAQGGAGPADHATWAPPVQEPTMTQPPVVQPPRVRTVLSPLTPTAPQVAATPLTVAEPEPAATPALDEPALVPRRLQEAMASTSRTRTTQAATDGRLQDFFGEPEQAPASSALVAAGSSPIIAWWMVPLLAALAGLNLWLRRRRPGRPRRDDAALKIVARQGLGGTSQLVVVEVLDGDGAPHRLLVGTGPEGPRLVSELTPAGAFADALDDAVTATPELDAAPPTPPAPTPGPAVVAEARPVLASPASGDTVTYAARRYRQVGRVGAPSPRPAAPAARTPAGPSLADRRRQARDLVNEVLAAREDGGWDA